jgi:RNA methyltransferase, TrmH family
VLAEPGADSDLLARAEAAGATVYSVAEGVLATATDTVTPQPVAAVAPIGDLMLEDALRHPIEQVLVMVGIADPGNLGTLLRTADAVGVDLVVCCDSSVDPYGPKSVRASAGALFRLRLVREAESTATVAALQERGLRCLGTVVRDETPYDQVDLTRPWAIVLGHEAHGLPDALRRRLDQLVTIPMRGPIESLNVGMAGTVVCFEALRQRRARISLAGRRTPGAGFTPR